MSDLNPLVPGDKFPTDAKRWNPVFEKVKEIEATAQRFSRATNRTPFLIKFTNQTGADLERYSVVELYAPLNEPGTNEIAFDSGDPILLGRKPSSSDAPAAVVVDPTRDGQPGLAIVCGAVQCSVDVGDAGHRFAKPITNDSSKFASNMSEGYPLLTSFAATGDQRAVVLLGIAVQGFLEVGVADSDIAVDSSGTVSIWRDGADSGENITAELDWMHGGKKVSQGKQVLIAKFGNIWRIIGAECENAS